MATGGSCSPSSRCVGKNILHWNGQDCVCWARQVCGESCLDPSTCDERRLVRLTGPQLLSLTTEQLELCVGVVAAPIFRESLDRISRLQDCAACKAGNQPMQCEGELGWSDIGEPTMAVSQRRGRCELHPTMESLDVSWGPGGYEGHQCHASTSHSRWREDPALASPCMLTTASPCYGSEGERHHSLPGATGGSGVPFLSLPTEELPQLDLLTVTDVLNDRDDAGYADFRVYNDASGSCEDQPFSLTGTEKFYPEGTPHCQSRGDCAIQNPPMGVSSESLGSDRWFAPYRVERDRLRRPEVWEYILRLLQDPHTENHLVEWVDRPRGVFKIIQRQQVARMWRDHWHKSKRGTPVNYENFAKSLSHHYSTGVLVRVPEQSTYQLGQEVLQKLDDGHRW